MRQECARHTDIQPATRYRVQHPDFACKFQRVVERRQDGAGHQPRVFRTLRSRSQKNDGVGAVAAIRVKVMFDGSYMRVA